MHKVYYYKPTNQVIIITKIDNNMFYIQEYPNEYMRYEGKLIKKDLVYLGVL